MRFTTFAILVALTGCNSAARWDADTHPILPSELAVSVNPFGGPDQTALSTKVHEGPPKTTSVGPRTTHTEKSDAEIAAETSWKLIMAGIGLVIAGFGLMYARSYTLGIAVPSWAPRAVCGLGGCLIIWGSLSPAIRDLVTIGMIVLVFGWMYYGSKNHNHKILSNL